LSELASKDPRRRPPTDATDGPRPGRIRKPIGWSMIVIAVLVAVSATLVWRRDGIDGVLEILTHDLTLFGGILPRVLAGCCLARSSRDLAPEKGVGSAGAEFRAEGIADRNGVGAILPGGPFTAYPWRARCSPSAPISAHHRHGRELDIESAMAGHCLNCRSWDRLHAVRIVISLPRPVLAGGLAVSSMSACIRAAPEPPHHRHHPCGPRLRLLGLSPGNVAGFSSRRRCAKAPRTSSIFGPRHRLGVIGSGYIAAVNSQEVFTGWLGPDSAGSASSPP